MKNVDVDINLPPNFMMTHLYRFDWFGHNWQLGQDKTVFLLSMDIFGFTVDFQIEEIDTI